MREVHVCWQHETRQIIKFEQLFVLVIMTWSLILVLQKLIGGTIPVLYDFKKFSYTLYGYFYTRPVCFYQLVKHATEATTSAIGLEYSNTPRIPCNEQHSYSLHQMFSSK